MTTITLPPDLELRLADEASRRGTTTELLAVAGLRKIFLSDPSNIGVEGPTTLFDFLSGFIGTVNGSTQPFSEDCGQHFADSLAEKQGRGQL